MGIEVGGDEGACAGRGDEEGEDGDATEMEPEGGDEGGNGSRQEKPDSRACGGPGECEKLLVGARRELVGNGGGDGAKGHEGEDGEGEVDEERIDGECVGGRDD